MILRVFLPAGSKKSPAGLNFFIFPIDKQTTLCYTVKAKESRHGTAVLTRSIGDRVNMVEDSQVHCGFLLWTWVLFALMFFFLLMFHQEVRDHS